MNDLILIIDDDTDVLALVDERLHMAGFSNTRTFSSPLGAINAVESGVVPSFVISDYNLPGISGLDLLRKITALHPGCGGLIITGKAHELDADASGFRVIDKGDIKFPKIIPEIVRGILGNGTTLPN